MARKGLMPVRKIDKTWIIDIRFLGRRYRQKSPENSKGSALAYESFLRQELAKCGTLSHLKKRADDQDNDLTFGSFANRWFRDYVTHNNKHSDRLSKDSILKKHLNPFFGKTLLKDVGSKQIEHYKQLKLSANYNPKTINNHLAVLHKCLAIAEEWGVIEHVPKIRLLKTTLPPPKYLTDAEAQRLLAVATVEPLHTMILTAIRTGVRHGELIALQWDDVDLKNRRICVKRCSVKGVVGTTKNGRVRYLPVTQDLADALRLIPRKCDLVFPGVQDNIMHHSITNRWINSAYEHAGIKASGWHILRHTFASQLVSRGASIKAVQDLLGHATLNMTLRYAHLSPETLRDTIRLLEPAPILNPESKFWAVDGQKEINRNPEVLEKLLSSISFSSPK